MVSQAIVYTRAHLGLNAPLISVEVHLANGLPGFHLVGMAETCVKEARDRVRSALANSDFVFPAKRITVNLAPADIRKQGGRYDLPIAIGILIAAGHLRNTSVAGYEIVGELGLMGDIKPVPALLPAAQASVQAQKKLIFPAAQRHELDMLPHPIGYPASSLLEVYHHFLQVKPLTSYQPSPLVAELPNPGWDDIQGQHLPKRALTIAAAGKHHLLMVGPPGSGKSSLAVRMQHLLPPLTVSQAIEVASVHAIAAVTSQRPWWQAPFRSPHHSSSAGALIGGGKQLTPGEASLAHHGVLFLDELPEFGRKTLETLREPLETQRIHLSRTAAQAAYPADFQLIAAMNPSPTGDWQDGRCSAEHIRRYLQRLSGPLLERFDLQVEVLNTTFQFCTDTSTETKVDSAVLAYQQVQLARERQYQRQGCVNARLETAALQRHCQLSATSVAWLTKLAEKLHLSQRSVQRILRVARTIADLEQSQQITHTHLTEAASYRALERIIHQLNAH